MHHLFWNPLRTGTSIAGALDSISDNLDAAGAMRPQDLQKQQNDDSAERLDQLLLVSAAMWELVKEKTGLTDEDLVNRVAVLDAQDGAADGKLTSSPRKCPKCARTVSAKHQRCLYCGAPVALDSIFKTI